jgi:hypothetical protein
MLMTLDVNAWLSKTRLGIDTISGPMIPHGAMIVTSWV